MSDQAPTPEEKLLCKALRALFAYKSASADDGDAFRVHFDTFVALRDEALRGAAMLGLLDAPTTRHVLDDGHACATCDAVPT